MKSFADAIRAKLQTYMPYGSTLLERKGTFHSLKSPNRKTSGVANGTSSLSISLKGGTLTSKNSISTRPRVNISGEISNDPSSQLVEKGRHSENLKVPKISV